MTDRRLEAKLGFDKVRETISNRCQTEYAADRVAGEEFSADPEEIRRRLLLTDYVYYGCLMVKSAACC